MRSNQRARRIWLGTRPAHEQGRACTAQRYPVQSANGVFAILKAFRLSKKADLIAALSLEAFDGRIDPFMDCIQQIRPHPGQIETGEAFRKLLAGSELIERPKRTYRILTHSVASRKCMVPRKTLSAMFPPYC